MLFLSRKIGESIIINDNITLTIQEIRGNSVKIGFDYPKTTRILRKEIFEKIQEENKAAAANADNIKTILEEGILQYPESPH
jgi:carbon storage regulator